MKPLPQTNKKIFPTLLIIVIFGITSLVGIRFLKRNFFTAKVKQTTICDRTNWAVLKNKAIQDKLDNDEIYALNSLGNQCRFYYRVKSVDIDKLFQSYNSSTNIYTKQAILSFFSSVQDRDLIRDKPELIATLKSVARKGDQFLSEIAIRILFDKEKIDFDEAIDIFNSLEDQTLKRLIFSKVTYGNNYDRDKLYGFFRSLVGSKDKSIAAQSFSQLIAIEGGDKWQSWEWSDWFGKTILKAAEGDFYLLSELDPLAMLEITKKYPNSKFTKACIEFRSPFPGDTYFGGKYTNEIRRPFFYKKELTMYADFMRKYPDHTASNDILYRQARAYELEGKYSKAITLYYNSLKVGDSDVFKSSVGDRIFFITNFLMDHNSIDKFISNNPEHPLNPYFSYTKVVHSIKEDKLDLAEKEVEYFISQYEKRLPKSYFGLINSYNIYDGFSKNSSNTYFWAEVRKQRDFIIKLKLIRSQSANDIALYEEAKLWANNNVSTYNLLALEHGYSLPIPDKWDGQNSTEKYLITSSAYNTAVKHNLWRNRYLRSIEKFETLFEKYPKSKLAAKAKYSIGLNYYWMGLRGYSYDNIDPHKLGIKTFREFVDQFPDSSMADDALISIADMSRDENERSQALQQIISKYPSGDRRKDAEKMMSNNSSSGSYNSLTSPSILLGIEMEDSSDGKVIIKKISFNSLADKNRLKEGDFILKIMGEAMKSGSNVVSKIKTYEPGDIIRIQILRDGKPSTFEIETLKEEETQYSDPKSDTRS
jgi:outer membrane protein assembly factor BamD (BamD/ComL family)